MQITGVDLENVKSYEHASIRFAPGTNAICGYNGAGKSTILEAIGFALFDALPMNQDELVREAEKTATVTVHVAGDDGRPFQVVRKCGSYNQYYVYDVEIDQKLTDGKSDTMGWLHTFTGVDRSGDLSALFQDAVGVPQGLLTAAFLETASRRKDVFNPLLRVDEYEEVWQKLREPASCLKDEITEKERIIAGLEGEVKALPAQKEKAVSLQASIAKDEAARAEAQAELDEVTKRKEDLAETKERLERLERSVAEAEGEAKTRKVQWDEAQEALRKAERARAVVSEAEQAHAAYLAAQARLDALEAERAKRDRLKEAHQACDKEMALATQRIAALEDDLEAIVRAEETISELKPKVELQQTLEEQLEAARREADRLEEKQSRLEEQQARLSALETRLSEVKEGLEAAAEVEQTIDRRTRELQEAAETRDELRSQVAACQAELAQVLEQTETLASTDKATCPVCEGPLTEQHCAALLERNRAVERELKERLEALQAEERALEAERQEVQATLDKDRARLKRLPRPGEKRELSNQIAAQREAIAELEEEIAELADISGKTEQLSAELDALGDPRRAYRRAADVSSRREEVERKLAAAEEEVVELNSRLAALREELAAYEDLDERIEAQHSIRESHADDHERYVSHIREAEAAADRREKVAAQEEALAAAEVERNRLMRERDEMAEVYDVEAHEELKETYDQLRSAIATLDAGLRHQRTQLAEAAATIEHLAGVEAELEDTRAEGDELEELLSLMAHLRQVVRDAGPKVTRALVKVISAQAAQLYADIMADRGSRLGWTEDYEIFLESEGRERGFQQLSGGEQMAAALAVRLALLKEVSSIDLAFFDEPTANLDDRRRNNLAEQILNVKGFSQLFVISHDDTFEQDTDNVVRVVKEDGRSRTIGE